MEEIEAKFLDIDPKNIEQKLLKLGAVKKYDRIFRDKVFDYPDLRLDKDHSWIRLRDKGDKVTLAFKKRLGTKDGKANDAGMEEVKVEVSNFDKTAEFFLKIGLWQKFDEEKRRMHFELEGVEVDIDWWPLMPAYLEIEGKTWDEVEKMARKLGLKWEDKKVLSGMQIYKMYGIREMDYEVLTFKGQKKRHD